MSSIEPYQLYRLPYRDSTLVPARPDSICLFSDTNKQADHDTHSAVTYSSCSSARMAGVPER